MKLGGFTVTDCNGTGLVKQQGIDVTGCFYRLTGFGDYISAQSTVHPRNADGRKQSADSSRYQADKQRYDGCNGDISSRMVNIRIISHRNQRYTYNNEYQSETSQKNSQCYFVRSLLASSAFYQSNHLVKKALTRLLRHQYLDFIRKNFCTTSYGTLVTTGLTDNRSRFTGNSTFVNGSQTFHNLTVGRNRISRFTNKIVAFLQT